MDIRGYPTNHGFPRASGTEAALGDAILAQQFQERIRELHRAGIMLCQRIHDMDGRLQALSDSFTRYKNVERTSKLIGIALQLIPIAGGAAAGLLSAGAEVADGFSYKDLFDCVFGLVQPSDDDVMLLTDCIFRRARISIAPETLRTLDASRRRSLEAMVLNAGFSIETLRLLFEDPSRELSANAIVLPLERSSSTGNDAEISGRETLMTFWSHKTRRLTKLRTLL